MVKHGNIFTVSLCPTIRQRLRWRNENICCQSPTAAAFQEVFLSTRRFHATAGQTIKIQMGVSKLFEKLLKKKKTPTRSFIPSDKCNYYKNLTFGLIISDTGSNIHTNAHNKN